MDFLFIFKCVAIAFSSAIIVMVSYHLTKNIGVSALGSGGIYDSVLMLFFGIIGSSFVGACWLSAVASWDWVAILFIVIAIPALLGLWSATDVKKNKTKQAALDKFRVEFENRTKENEESNLPSYMKRLNSKFSDDKVGQTFITTIKTSKQKDIGNEKNEDE
jgi:hypothetical protein